MSQIFVDSEQTLLNYFKRKESEDLDSTMGHTIIKIAAAATENNQPLDARRCFPILISNVKQNTMNSNISRQMSQWDKIVKELQDEGQLVLNLSSSSVKTRSSVSSLCSKMKTIRDIIGIIPESFQKALTLDNVRKSFVKTGYISTGVKNDNHYIECPNVFMVMNQNKIKWKGAKIVYQEENGNVIERNMWDHFVEHIPDAVHEYKKHYKIPESWFDNNNFPVDTRISGDEVPRVPTDAEYHMQRTMTVHNKLNRQRMDNAIADAVSKKNKAMLLHYSKAEDFFKHNQQCEDILRNISGISNDASLNDCTIEHFMHKSILKKHLLGFVKVRYSENIYCDDSEIPNIKGSKKTCDEGNEDTLLHWAYSHRAEKVIAALPQQVELMDADNQSTQMLDLESVTVNTGHTGDLLPITGETVVNVPTWELNPDFIRCSFRFIGSLIVKGEEYEIDMISKIEDLNDNTLTEQHIKPRYGHRLTQHGLKRDHYTVRFTLANMQRAVVILKMHGHLREEHNLKMFNYNDDLFKNDFHDTAEKIIGRNVNNGEYKKEKGVYLYIDRNRNWVIRAGSTCTSFLQRHNEHSKGAKLESEKSKDSLFYCSYPHDSVQVDGALSSLQKGRWSDLEIVTGVRWTKEHRENIMDLFAWDKSVIGGLNRNRTKGTLLDKKERMVAYLFETVLGLCIASFKNISSNPSFESFNGTFSS